MYTLAITYTPYLKRTMAMLAAVVTLSVFLYGIFLLEAVGNTAQLSAAEHQIQGLTSSVASLEQTYLSATRDMTPQRAQLMGLVTPTQVTTVFATAQSQSLSLLQ